MSKTISIICPTFNEEKYITSCINSMICQDFDKKDIELLFVDGRSSDRTRKIIEEYTNSYSWISMIDTPERTVPFAMDYATTAGRGDAIVRIASHAESTATYIRVVVNKLKVW